MDAGDIPTTTTGLYQYIIATLAAVITTLAGGNALQWRTSNTVNAARLAEQEKLYKALADVNAALVAFEATSARRNEVMDKMGELINQVSVALKLLTDRLEIQHEHTSKDLEKAVEVTETMADAVRTVASRVETGFAEIKGKL